MKLVRFCSGTMLAVAAVIATAAHAQQAGGMGGGMGGGMQGRQMMANGLYMPAMDPALGRKLFASKGCVVCHSVNGVGGKDAPTLDASTMQMPMNPFEFAARMWDGAAAMIAMQEDELGGPIHLAGHELASIIAFAHDAAEQAKFSDADIPEQIRDLMEEDEEK